MSAGKREILTTINREDNIKVASIYPVKFKREVGVIIKIRQFMHTHKKIPYIQHTCSKILKVIHSEISRQTATLCIMKLSTFSRTTRCTTNILVTFTTKLNTAIQTELKFHHCLSQPLSVPFRKHKKL
jgi:tRNA A37 methylthiotransferase MiaB